MERKYQSTHAHISFSLDMTGNEYDIWLMLGAAESKCRHMAGIPLRPEKQKEINRITFTKGIHATTAIEGNMLSVAEVNTIINSPDIQFGRSKAYQRREVENAVKLYNEVIEEIKRTGTCRVGVDALMSDDAGFLDGLELRDGVVPGELRTYSVAVANYVAPPAEDCEYLLMRLFDWLGDDWGLAEHRTIEYILKALMFHLYIAWIHPFGDGNGRTARLSEFRLLMRAGIPLNAAHLLTTHYNATRSEYYLALSEPLRFIRYALSGFIDALDTQIDEILIEQRDVTWSNYIHSAFGGALSDARARQRDLLLDLSRHDAVSADMLISYLGESMRKRYSALSSRTLARDLGALENGGFIVRDKGQVIPQKDMMKAFMPIKSSA